MTTHSTDSPIHFSRSQNADVFFRSPRSHRNVIIFVVLCFVSFIHFYVLSYNAGSLFSLRSCRNVNTLFVWCFVSFVHFHAPSYDAVFFSRSLPSLSGFISTFTLHDDVFHWVNDPKMQMSFFWVALIAWEYKCLFFFVFSVVFHAPGPPLPRFKFASGYASVWC